MGSLNSNSLSFLALYYLYEASTYSIESAIFSSPNGFGSLVNSESVSGNGILSIALIHYLLNIYRRGPVACSQVFFVGFEFREISTINFIKSSNTFKM